MSMKDIFKRSHRGPFFNPVFKTVLTALLSACILIQTVSYAPFALIKAHAEENNGISVTYTIYHQHTGNSDSGGGCYNIARTGTRSYEEPCGGTLYYWGDDWGTSECDRCGASYHGDRGGQSCPHSETRYESYTYFNMFGGAVQILSMMIFYPLLRKITENVRIFYICITSAVIGYACLLAITFTTMKSVFILFVPAFFIFAANGVLQVLTTVFLANSVDYGEVVNNRRDESVIFSMQTFVVKLASGVAAFIASICLSLNRLGSEEITETEKSIDFSLQVDASSRLGLRMTMTILPVAGLFIAIVYFKRKFILDEAKMEEISRDLKTSKENIFAAEEGS